MNDKVSAEDWNRPEHDCTARRPGRPRKSPPPANSGAAGAATPPRRRGRPRKVAVNSATERPSPVVSSTDEFFELWLPFEMEIGRITGAVAPAGQDTLPGIELSGGVEESGTGGVDREAQRMLLRRRLLERLFEESEAGESTARVAVDALSAVMNLFGSRTAFVIEQDEFSRQAKAPGQEAPGPVALRQLAHDPEFLKLANTYSSFFQRWLIDSIARSGEAFSEADSTTDGDIEPGPPALRLAARTVPLPQILKFFNDSVHGVAVRALSRPAEWEPREGFAYAFQQVYAAANVTIGLPDREPAQDLWEFLRRGGPRMVKAHYALWARYYEDYVEGGPRYIVVSVPQFCNDIGLKKHKKGGYRPEHKREAMKMLSALAAIEMRVEKVMPDGKRRRIRGPLWARGLEAEERDSYSDLFGSARVEPANDWEPTAFSFAPGPWFDDPEWRRYHRFMGKIGSGLLRLSSDTDQWAILIGGYLGTLGRTRQYRPLKLKIGTILRNSGLAQSEDAQRRKAQNLAKLEAALDRLQSPEIGVINSWRLLGTEVTEPDMDDMDALADYAAADVYPPGDWRNWLVEISLPMEEDRERLESQQERVIVSKKRAASGRRSVSSSDESSI